MAAQEIPNSQTNTEQSKQSESKSPNTERYTLVEYPIQFGQGIKDNKTGDIYPIGDPTLLLTLINKINKQVSEI